MEAPSGRRQRETSAPRQVRSSGRMGNLQELERQGTRGTMAIATMSGTKARGPVPMQARSSDCIFSGLQIRGRQGQALGLQAHSSDMSSVIQLQQCNSSGLQITSAPRAGAESSGSLQYHVFSDTATAMQLQRPSGTRAPRQALSLQAHSSNMSSAIQLQQCNSSGLQIRAPTPPPPSVPSPPKL